MLDPRAAVEIAHNNGYERGYKAGYAAGLRAPRTIAYWDKAQEDRYCSHCGTVHSGPITNARFCSYCGCEMRIREEE